MTVPFDLPDDVAKLCDEIREWSVQQVRPLARECDRSEGLPPEADAVMAACPVGLSPLAIATFGRTQSDWGTEFSLDGFTTQYVLGAAVSEAIGYGDSWPLATLRGSIAEKAILAMGTQEQKEKWVGGFMRGEFRSSAFALTEPHFGSDVSQVATTATRTADGWVIRGSKMYCSLGASADYTVVFATIDKDAGRNGIRAFVVTKDMPGYVVTKARENKLGMRAFETSALSFDDLHVPADALLGGEEQDSRGFYAALGTLNTSRPLTAAWAVGIGAGCVDYLEQWTRQHGRAFSIQRRRRIEEEVARMRWSLADARLMYLRAAMLQDGGRDNRREASAAKAYAPQVAEAACRRVAEIMGPDGASERHLVEKWCRDIRIFDIWEGSGQIQRLTISRMLMGSSAGRA
jgi:alkylation response protein AidB-like acyl-CoA dehydrogenase